MVAPLFLSHGDAFSAPRFLGLLVLAAFALAASTAGASNITYTLTPVSMVENPFSSPVSGFTLTETITTSGTLGSLPTGFSYHWTVTNGTTTYSGSGPGISDSETNLTATASGLSFPWAPAPTGTAPDANQGGQLTMQNGGSQTELQLSTNSLQPSQGVFDYTYSAYIGIAPSGPSFMGIVDFGSTAPASPYAFAAVPEPSSLVLAAIGLAGLSLLGRRKR